MAQKKIPYLQVVRPPDDIKEVKKKDRKFRGEKIRRILVPVILAALAVCGAYLLLDNQGYGKARTAASYTNELSDTNSYARFSNGIVRYNRDGVVFLDRQNEEKWIYPAQLQNPVIKVRKDAFAIADSGGNTILVFTKDGIKGEIETTLPIESFTVSDQGIVSAILRNESSPMIISYDAAGNILVEQQVTLNNTGYPAALELSDDGNVLAVSYLYTQGTVLGSRVVFYNFGETGQGKADNIVLSEEYTDTLMADIFYMNGDRAVAVGDNAFAIYRGNDVPEKVKEVSLNQEIRSVFHSDRYFGFILLNQEKSGYEVRLYDRNGNQLMSREISGEYDNVKIDGDEILMYDGPRICIVKANGIIKFQGELDADVMEIFCAAGINRYYVMSVNELSIIYLTK